MVARPFSIDLSVRSNPDGVLPPAERARRAEAARRST
jgi:hypothetical protein